MSTEPALFQSIPNKDNFSLFRKGKPNGEKIVNVLNYSKKDVSSATGLPAGSVRYDAKMPDELQQRLTEWAIAINLVGDFFGDFEKTMLWFGTDNPLLGHVSPRDMIRVGRFKKLLRFIQTALDENRR